MGRGHRLLALGRLAHLFLVSKATSCFGICLLSFWWFHLSAGSFLSRQILRVCILNGVCSELRSAACSASVLSKSVASSFTICDTEAIAVKRSGEHINKKSFNYLCGEELQLQIANTLSVRRFRQCTVLHEYDSVGEETSVKDGLCPYV